MSADWRKSTHSGGNGANCVEVATWRKSTHSGGQCVEFGTATVGVLVRDTTDNGKGLTLHVTPAAWRTLLAGIRV